jgi:hypothetical protein
MDGSGRPRRETHNSHRDAFAERALRNIGEDRAGHSGLMPADLITFALFSVSSAMSFPKSAGEPVTLAATGTQCSLSGAMSSPQRRSRDWQAIERDGGAAQDTIAFVA